jgi:hypothetical protein
MRQLAIYGAIDRFNYGDLLFPMILEKVFEPFHSKLLIDCYGTVERDMTSYGGRRCKSVKQLLAPGNLQAGAIVMIAGGEMLSATWAKIYRYLLPASRSSMLMAFEKILPPQLLNSSIQRRFDIPLELPFVVAPTDFSTQVQVAYNAVGGSSANRLPKTLKDALKEKLRKAAYLSLRDKASLTCLGSKDFGISAECAPDSAILLSRYFPSESLTSGSNSRTNGILRRFAEGYLCFQINRYRAWGNVHAIVRQLERIYHESGLPVVLCPIGTAAGHEDHVPLERIKRLIRTPCEIVDVQHVSDILAVLGSARLYAGTSLHGAITAMSYRVPYLGLTNKVTKLTAYLQTWAIPELQECVPIEDLAKRAQDALSIDRSKLESACENSIDRSLASFERMFAALGL